MRASVSLSLRTLSQLLINFLWFEPLSLSRGAWPMAFDACEHGVCQGGVRLVLRQKTCLTGIFQHRLAEAVSVCLADGHSWQ